MSIIMNFFIETFGCKVNQYDSQEIANQMINHGFTRSQEASAADVIIINSCTVTAESDRKARGAVRRHRRKNPTSVVVLAGCLPQANPDMYANFPDADIVVGNRSNNKIAEMITAFMDNRIKSSDIQTHRKGDAFIGEGITCFEDHTRAFVKIQDGCDRFCSYCIIPVSRGRSRSKELPKLKNELNALANNGYKEIVLVGINLSDYGKNTPNSLADAIFAAEDISGIRRIRLGSLEPDYLTLALLNDFKQSTKLCPHFHLSLQSGSDSILKAMNRHYTSAEFLELCETLRRLFPDCALTTDIITGFPGETEKDFNASVDLVKKVRFEKIHIFPYSKRENTKAAQMSNHIPNSEKKRRAAFLSRIAEEIRREIMCAQIGKEYEVLLENSSANGFEGYTRNYFPVNIQSQKHQSGNLFNVKIIAANDEYLFGVESGVESES